jgi:hypothetical protein
MIKSVSYDETNQINYSNRFLAVEKITRKNLLEFFLNHSKVKKREKVGTKTQLSKTQRQLLGNHFGKKLAYKSKVCFKTNFKTNNLDMNETMTLFEIYPFESFVDLVVRLNMTSENVFINIYKVINGKRKQMYGWSRFIYPNKINMAICSH